MSISANGSPIAVPQARLRVVPPYTTTFGAEAADLALLAGLRLDPWQREGINDMLAFADNGQWVCFEYADVVPRQNGKGGEAEARALAGMFLLGEKMIMWSAHEYKTATEAFLRMREYIYTLERESVIQRGLIRIVGGHGDETLENRDTGQRIKFIARSKSSGRGFTGDVNIIDETFAFTPIQQAALMPTMSARANPQIIYTSTPPLDGDSGEVLFALKERALLGNDPSLGYRDWGAPGTLDDLATLDLDDRTLWAKANPAFGIRISEETIARERRSMGHLEFARERLGIWPKRRMGGGAVDFDKWKALADHASFRSGACALGIDIAVDRSCAAIGLYGAGRTIDDQVVGHAQLVSYDYGTKWIVARLAELVAAVSPVAIGMARGTHSSLETELTRAGHHVPDDPEHPVRGDLLVLSGPDMAAACGHMIDAVRDSTFRVKPDAAAPEVLDAAVAGAQIKQGAEAISWSRKGDEEIAPLVALTVARFAYINRAEAQQTRDTVFFGAWV